MILKHGNAAIFPHPQKSLRFFSEFSAIFWRFSAISAVKPVILRFAIWKRNDFFLGLPFFSGTLYGGTRRVHANWWFSRTRRFFFVNSPYFFGNAPYSGKYLLGPILAYRSFFGLAWQGECWMLLTAAYHFLRRPTNQPPLTKKTFHPHEPSHYVFCG